MNFLIGPVLLLLYLKHIADFVNPNEKYTVVHKCSKNLGPTSKFKAPEGSHEASSIHLQILGVIVQNSDAWETCHIVFVHLWKYVHAVYRYLPTRKHIF